MFYKIIIKMNIFIIRALLAGQLIVCGLISALISFTLQNETGLLLISILWLFGMSILTGGDYIVSKYLPASQNHKVYAAPQQ